MDVFQVLKCYFFKRRVLLSHLWLVGNFRAVVFSPDYSPGNRVLQIKGEHQ